MPVRTDLLRPFSGLAALAAAVVLLFVAAPATAQWVPEEAAAVRFAPTETPDRVILTWRGDPATTQAVTWRTDTSVNGAVAEIAVEDAHPDINTDTVRVEAATTPVETAETGAAQNHSAEFTDLQPNTLYAYRVGDGDEHWSEWLQFRTASEAFEPFSFIYFGDAQNDVRSKWSRAIRAAALDAPDARFMVHSGDLINIAHRDTEWGEWFEAGGWLNGMIPSIPSTGNHEYHRTDENDPVGDLSVQWRPQFTLPEHGPEGMEETVYYIDYPGVRIISLNSTEAVRDEPRAIAQAEWLEGVLADNDSRWTVVTFHHPVFSVARGRDNPALREHWQPLFEEHGVDLVLQGHDHTYGRGANLSEGANVRDGDDGPMYVVSVAGPKMYDIDEGAEWMKRLAEDTQLYQIIHVEEDRLRFESRTVAGELYDGFDLVKQDNGVNQLVDRMPDTPERRRAPEVAEEEEAREAVAVPAETLERYVGRYRLRDDPGVVLTVTRNEAQLYVEAAGEPRMPVFAASENEFFARAVDAELTFMDGTGGDVNRAELHYQSLRLQADRVQ